MTPLYTWLCAIGAAAYAIIFIIPASAVFTCWLHDTKREFSQSWILSILVGISLAAVWPVSLTLLMFYVNRNEESCQDSEV